jgi:hypothetical protein
MKRVRSVMAAALMAVLLVGGGLEAKLKAQLGPGEIFTVPFAFTADGHEIQAGTYEVRRDSSEFLISIRNLKTGDKQLFSVRPEQRTSVPAEGILVFQGCGERKELSEFHIRGSNFFSATIDSRRKTSPEVEGCSHSNTVTLAAR